MFELNWHANIKMQNFHHHKETNKCLRTIQLIAVKTTQVWVYLLL